MARDTIYIQDKEYVNVKLAAEAVKLSEGRLREMARSYDKRKNRPPAKHIPCHKQGRLYYFNLHDLKVALGLKPGKATPARKEIDYLAGL